MNPLRRAARLHIGLVIAKALYKDKDAHRADFELLRRGRDGVLLTREEKLTVVKAMLRRAGKSTTEVWLPPSVLWGLGLVTSGMSRRHRAKQDKKDLNRARGLAVKTGEQGLTTFTPEELEELRRK